MTDINEWTGPVGDVWAQEWQRTDRSFGELNALLFPAIIAAAPEHGTAIDIGCGAGQTAIALAAARAKLDITGIDISEGLLEVAHHRAEDLPNVRFEHGDASAAATGHAPVDLYISRHGVMFFDDPLRAFAAFRKVASPDARMVFSCFRDWTLNSFAFEIAKLANDGAPSPDAPGPFAFASEQKVEDLLTKAGWRDAHATPVDFNYIAGQGDDPVADAVSFMRRIGPAARAIRAVEEEKRPAIIDGLREICEAHRNGDAVLFPAAAWIWTARA